VSDKCLNHPGKTGSPISRRTKKPGNASFPASRAPAHLNFTISKEKRKKGKESLKKSRNSRGTDKIVEFSFCKRNVWEKNLEERTTWGVRLSRSRDG